MAGLVPIRARWLFGLRAAWAALAITTIALFILALPARYDQITEHSAGFALALTRIGMPANVYAGISIAIDGGYILVSIGIAWLLLVRSGRVPMALFVALFLVPFAAATSSTIDTLAQEQGPANLIVSVLGAIGYAGLNGLFYLFPNGHFVPRWTRVMLAIAVIGQIPFGFPETSPYNPNSWPTPILLPLLLAIFGTAVLAQIDRYIRVSSPAERQQTKWVVCGATAAIVLMVIARSPGLTEALAGNAGAALVRGPLMDLGLLLIPVSIGISALHYRLWDIDVIINRTLVYASLTALVIVLYVLVVGYLSSVLRIGHTLPVSLVATGVVAIVFHPVRQWLQRGVNRLMYGERDDPYAVLTHLGAQLESILAPNAALPAIVETVARTLKLPYAAVVLTTGGDAGLTVSRGLPSGRVLTLPLVYGADPVGQLIAGHRPGESGFSPADRRLLADLARQAGAAAYTVRLMADLQRTRERLVTTREEERRRLRRDLHDGLGPALSALSLRIGAARNILPTDPARADTLLAELIDEVAAAIADIRRLVYELRPPALDDLGLVGALRAFATQLGSEGHRTIDVRVEVIAPLPALSAAIEVAAFRIAQEALTNVARHAEAQTCFVRLSHTATAIQIEIVDDGIGLPLGCHAGVGIVSMRERAEELGGTCLIEPISTGGTRVSAELPFPAGERS